jgi:hypothetical protein
VLTPGSSLFLQRFRRTFLTATIIGVLQKPRRNKIRQLQKAGRRTKQSGRDVYGRNDAEQVLEDAMGIWKRSQKLKKLQKLQKLLQNASPSGS